VVEGGRIRIDGSTDLRDDGVVIDAPIRVKGVRLDRLRPYLGDLGWTALGWRLSGRLHYQRDPGRRDQLTDASRSGVSRYTSPRSPAPP
jgi:hypothetical protein